MHQFLYHSRLGRLHQILFIPSTCLHEAGHYLLAKIFGFKILDVQWFRFIDNKYSSSGHVEARITFRSYWTFLNSMLQSLAGSLVNLLIGVMLITISFSFSWMYSWIFLVFAWRQLGSAFHSLVISKNRPSDGSLFLGHFWLIENGTRTRKVVFAIAKITNLVGPGSFRQIVKTNRPITLMEREARVNSKSEESSDPPRSDTSFVLLNTYLYSILFLYLLVAVGSWIGKESWFLVLIFILGTS